MNTSIDTVATTLRLTPRERAERVLARFPEAEAGPAAGGRGIDDATLASAGARINEVLRPYGLEFEPDETSGRTVIRVVDRLTGEVIRQIPPEEMLAIAERLDEARGRLLRLKV